MYKDKEWLRKQYLSLGKSSSEIAFDSGVSKRTICDWLHRHEIPIKPKHKRTLQRIRKYGLPWQGKPSPHKGKSRSSDFSERVSNGLRGKKKSAEHRERISKATMGREPWNKGISMADRKAEKNLQWRGEEASVSAKHMYVRRNWEKENKCEHCGQGKNTQWSNKYHTYNRNKREDWQELCVSCHHKYDFKTGLRSNKRKINTSRTS